MAHNPKLEVYQIWMVAEPDNRNGQIKDFLAKKFGTSGHSTTATLYQALLSSFIGELDSNQFIKDDKKKKAFTAYNANQTAGVNQTIRIHSSAFIIEGTIEGGRFGQKRGRAPIGNKVQKDDVAATDIILDTFYFFLYLPPSSKMGTLLLQSYSTDSISDVFKDFLSKYFKVPGAFKKANISKFFPEQIKEDFRNNSNLKEFSYESQITLNGFGGIADDNETFSLRITAESRSGISKGLLGWVLEKLGMKEFDGRKLSDFPKKRGKLLNEQSKKETTFELDSENIDIHPVIQLEGKIMVDIEGIPDFEQLKSFCFELLSQIRPELYPSDAVEER